jgi:hypothetical protein
VPYGTLSNFVKYRSALTAIHIRVAQPLRSLNLFKRFNCECQKMAFALSESDPLRQVMNRPAVPYGLRIISHFKPYMNNILIQADEVLSLVMASEGEK